MIEDLWYKNAVIYSLDLETFMDGNGDGVGDFEGLKTRLDYLHALGVDAVWLAPFQPSPNKDNGYDISDYYGVDPRHGSSGNFVEFMHQATKRGIKVIIDLVVNHTSDEHAWFQDARPSSQWAHFLRNHDELDLGRLTEEQRQKVFDRFGPDKNMQLYDRGIRRRLATMIGNRPQVELAYSLLFALPGTPVIRYGDEIGMGDDLTLKERDAVRTPMQWSSEKNAGFSTSEKLFHPVVCEGPYSFTTMNVETQRRQPESLLNWMTDLIRLRQECTEIGWGDWCLLDTGSSAVLGLYYKWQESSLITLHNFDEKAVEVCLDIKQKKESKLVDLMQVEENLADEKGVHRIRLGAYAYRWFRAGDLSHLLQKKPIQK
jgi:glycosidase